MPAYACNITRCQDLIENHAAALTWSKIGDQACTVQSIGNRAEYCMQMDGKSQELACTLLRCCSHGYFCRSSTQAPRCQRFYPSCEFMLPSLLLMLFCWVLKN